MTERLPTLRALSMISSQDGQFALQRIADQIAEERRHILSGHYSPGPGHTRRSILAANRSKLWRLHARAREMNAKLENDTLKATLAELDSRMHLLHARLIEMDVMSARIDVMLSRLTESELRPLDGRPN